MVTFFFNQENLTYTSTLLIYNGFFSFSIKQNLTYTPTLLVYNG